MKISMLAIGDELFENTVEINSLYLAELLLKEGLKIFRVLKVRDNLEEIVEGFKFLSKDSDVIFSCGGLGPTEDDLTKEGLAQFLGEKLYLNQEVLKHIKQFFASKNRVFHPSNEKQAFIFENSTILENLYGTAPGLYLNRGKNEYILLPGVPTEWKEMLNRYLPDFLNLWKDKLKNLEKRYSIFYGSFGISEGELDSLIKEKIKEYKINYGTIAKSGIIIFRLDIVAKDKDEAKIIADGFVERELKSIKKNIFRNEFDTIEQFVVDRLSKRGEMLVVAESCTGGLLSKKLTDVAGSSKVFYGGIICYSNEVKENLLKVPSEVIEKYGAVSYETVYEMDKGLKILFPSVKYRISISGIAGPDGGTKEKPVGTVFIAFGNNNEVKIERLGFLGNRSEIREKSVNYALSLLVKEVL